MEKKLLKLKNDIKNVNKRINAINIAPSRSVSKSNRRRPRRGNRAVERFAPAAIGAVEAPYVKMRTLRSGETQIEFLEFFPLADVAETGLAAIVPVSPTLWAGKRTGAIVAQYTSFRPIMLRVGYVTSSPTTTSGTVAVGTLFDDAEIVSSEHMVIAALKGGFITSAWQSHWTQVRLGTSLRTNTYPTDNIGHDDIPCVVVCSRENVMTTGYIGVHAIMTLHNPTVGLRTMPKFQSQTILATPTFVTDTQMRVTLPAPSNVGIGDKLAFFVNGAGSATTYGFWGNVWNGIKRIVGVVESVAEGILTVMFYLELAGIVALADGEESYPPIYVTFAGDEENFQ